MYLQTKLKEKNQIETLDFSYCEKNIAFAKISINLSIEISIL